MGISESISSSTKMCVSFVIGKGMQNKKKGESYQQIEKTSIFLFSFPLISNSFSFFLFFFCLSLVVLVFSILCRLGFAYVHLAFNFNLKLGKVLPFPTSSKKHCPISHFNGAVIEQHPNLPRGIGWRPPDPIAPVPQPPSSRSPRR